MSRLTEGPWEATTRRRVIATRTGAVVAVAEEDDDALEIARMRNDEPVLKARIVELEAGLAGSASAIKQLRDELAQARGGKQHNQQRRTVDEAEKK